MFVSEVEFHSVAQKTLEALNDALEAADASGAAEVELQGGILTIAFENGKQFIVNKHAPSQQIWLSSPLSGGLHFSYDNGQWKVSDGRVLETLLAQELKTLGDIEMVLA